MATHPSPCRRFQFRLRTLLIVVTLLAALSAAVTWVIRDRQRLIRERDEAIERAHNRAKAMAWMERARQAEERESQAKAELSIIKYSRLPWPPGP